MFIAGRTDHKNMQTQLGQLFDFGSSIRKRFIVSFSALVFIFAGSVLLATIKVVDISDISHRIVKLRVPTSSLSAQLVIDIHGTLDTLRGWMLTGDTTFKTERAVIWANMDETLETMDRLLPTWTDRQTIQDYKLVKNILSEFRSAQDKVEDIAHGAGEFPANVLLQSEAEPFTDIIIQQITALIDEEISLPASRERKDLLGSMADFRGSMAMSLANIRSYLMTGNIEFKNRFESTWTTNEQRFTALTRQQELMTLAQVRGFETLVSARNQFAPLPSRMFAIRASTRWNMANYTLVTETVPRASKILEILSGAVSADGNRSGGMIGNQKKLLNTDAAAADTESQHLLTMNWILLVLGILIATTVIILLNRSVVAPLVSITRRITQLASGDYSDALDNLQRRDELGALVTAFRNMLTRIDSRDREIKQLNADLEQLVAERTVELQAANRELESFAYAIAHDLRAPLRGMGGFSQALLEDYGESLETEAKTYLDHIIAGSTRMGELVDGLLTLSRSTRGELQRNELDLSALAERLLAELARIEPERQLSWGVAPGPVTRGDGRMLEAVLRNLLGNAWKYTEGTAEAKIRVYADKDNQQPVFCIEDNGAGFDMAHAGKLFQPFQRLHRQDEFVGIGIGLATVQRIVHRHGGEIQAHSTQGQGARFCFSLENLTAND